MALKNPTPPTPPTPPSMDRGDGANSHAKIDAPNFFQVPFVNDGGVNFKNPATETFQGEENFSEDEVVEEENSEQTPQQNSAVGKKEVTTPETLARDAVANGAGALTKKTVTKPEQENSAAPKNQTQITIPSDADRILNDSERGKAVLREFQEEDLKISGDGEKNQTSTETPKSFQNNFTQPQQGGLYWIVILIFAIVGGFVFVKKFLITDKPKLKKSDFFEGSSERLKNVSDKVSKPVKKSPQPVLKNYSVQPAKTISKPVQPQKKDDDGGKHFEVRV